jgi:hypothetical protein
MSHFSELYQPCPVEEFLSSELGVWSYNVMLFAVQHPALQQFRLDSHVKPAIRSLKAAGLDHTDIWFVITKRLELLSDPISLQRWLDFMAAQVSLQHLPGWQQGRAGMCIELGAVLCAGPYQAGRARAFAVTILDPLVQTLHPPASSFPLPLHVHACP